MFLNAEFCFFRFNLEASVPFFTWCLIVEGIVRAYILDLHNDDNLGITDSQYYACIILL